MYARACMHMRVCACVRVHAVFFNPYNAESSACCLWMAVFVCDRCVKVLVSCTEHACTGENVQQ